jgi:1,4-alpha-glucan branching enzyme
LHPGKKLLFMGQEFGQPSEWSEERGLDWWILDQPAHQGLARLVGQLNALYKAHPQMWEQDNEPAGFEWIEGGDAQNNLVAFIRRDTKGTPMVGVFNFGGNPLNDYRLAINTDAEDFGGSGVGNFGTVTSVHVPWGGRDASAVIQVPPLGGLWLTLEK